MDATIIGLLAVIIVIVVIFVILWYKKLWLFAPREEYFEDMSMEQQPQYFSGNAFRCPSCDSEVDMYGMSCPICGVVFQEGAFECPKCGEPAEPDMLQCANCGEIFVDEPSLCPKCGVVVSPTATSCDKCRETFWSPITPSGRGQGDIEKEGSKLAAEDDAAARLA